MTSNKVTSSLDINEGITIVLQSGKESNQKIEEPNRKRGWQLNISSQIKQLYNMAEETFLFFLFFYNLNFFSKEEEGSQILTRSLSVQTCSFTAELSLCGCKKIKYRQSVLQDNVTF